MKKSIGNFLYFKHIHAVLLPVLLFMIFFSCTKSTENIHHINLTRQTYSNSIELIGVVEAANSASVICPGRLSGDVIYIVEDGTWVNKGDTICIIENREYTNHYETLLNTVEQSEALYNKGKADLEMSYALLEAQVKNNEAQAAIANLDSAQLLYLPKHKRKIKELQLQIAQIEKEKYEKKLRFLEQINESELRKLELKISQDKMQAQSIKLLLDQMVMLAPCDGIAIRSRLRYTREKIKKGDEVWAGIQVAEIPNSTVVKATIMASETNYKRIALNNRVQFSFDAIPGNSAWGKITKKAAMGQPVSRNSKIREFEISASIDSFITLPEIGISANCKVIIEQITDTVVVPQLAIFDQDSAKVVYIKNKHNAYKQQQVLLGENSPKLAVIIAGLNGNETVSLIKPKASKIYKKAFLPDSVLTAANIAKQKQGNNHLPQKPEKPVIIHKPNMR